MQYKIRKLRSSKASVFNNKQLEVNYCQYESLAEHSGQDNHFPSHQLTRVVCLLQRAHQVAEIDDLANSSTQLAVTLYSSVRQIEDVSHIHFCSTRRVVRSRIKVDGGSHF
jgi:hypothetical protein